MPDGAASPGGPVMEGAAEAVFECLELEPTIDFFTQRLGFALALITPADGPREAVLDGHGTRIRLEVRPDDGRLAPGRLRLACVDPDGLAPDGRLVAPNGTVVDVVSSSPELEVPPVAPVFELSRLIPSAFSVGRAGMEYRDLLPERQGGRFVASHIRIPVGGPVPDYVHHHRIRFQMIYCYRGWARLVYEDQGPPFLLRPGDCALQPPGIRHQVLEASDGLEVVEIGCPAVHDTMTDRAMTLPTTVRAPDRLFDGQRFVRHEAESARWEAHRTDSGAEVAVQDFGIAEATGGLASVRALRPTPAASLAVAGGAELAFYFVVAGEATVTNESTGVGERLGEADSVALPPGEGWTIGACSSGAELLEVCLPASTLAT